MKSISGVQPERRHHRPGVVVAGLTGLATVSVAAAELKPATVEAFQRYVRLTEARIEREVAGKDPFLWIDRQPEIERRRLAPQLAAGEVAVARLETRDNGREIEVPDGLIHHWVGTIVLPRVGLDRARAMVQDYNQYARIYNPNVRSGRVLSRDGDAFKVYLQLFMKKVISVVLNTEYDVWYHSPGAGRLHAKSYTTRIAEVEDADGPSPTEKPVGRDNGFLWRFYNYCSFEERPEGTYMQCESVSLSRDVPFGLGWLIRPFVTGIPKDMLTFTLQAARRELTQMGP
jgi:hypothetical protein